MEKKLELSGKFKVYIEYKKFEKLKKDILRNKKNLKELGIEYGISEYSMAKMFTLGYFNLDSKTVLNSKKEAYYIDEEEIEASLSHDYTWEDLSEEEKKFYLNYKK
jgi:hypothetical protein